MFRGGRASGMLMPFCSFEWFPFSVTSGSRCLHCNLAYLFCPSRPHSYWTLLATKPFERPELRRSQSWLISTSLVSMTIGCCTTLPTRTKSWLLDLPKFWSPCVHMKSDMPHQGRPHKYQASLRIERVPRALRARLRIVDEGIKKDNDADRSASMR